METRDDERMALLALLRERSLERGEFVLASGERSSYYIDGRRTTMSGAGQLLIGRLGLAAIQDAGWDAASIGGLTLGADPVAYAIAHAAAAAGLPLDAFTVRKQAKQHGTGRLIEGGFAPGTAVVVVEDVVTSGESALKAVHAVRAADSSVLGVLCVVDREQGGRERLEREGLPLVALFTATQLLGDG